MQARIREMYPKAVYVHCAAHNFNLVLSAACKIPEISFAFKLIEEITFYFNASQNRVRLLEQIIKTEVKDADRLRLLNLCITRSVVPKKLIRKFDFDFVI